MQRMTLQRPWRMWDPWSELHRLREELDRAFPSVFAEELEFPVINIGRLPDRVVVEAVAPGVDRSTLDITAVGNTLTIRGERQPESGVEPGPHVVRWLSPPSPQRAQVRLLHQVLGLRPRAGQPPGQVVDQLQVLVHRPQEFVVAHLPTHPTGRTRRARI